MRGSHEVLEHLMTCAGCSGIHTQQLTLHHRSIITSLPVFDKGVVCIVLCMKARCTDQITLGDIRTPRLLFLDEAKVREAPRLGTRGRGRGGLRSARPTETHPPSESAP
jgi:hypothetical protein